MRRTANRLLCLLLLSLCWVSASAAAESCSQTPHPTFLVSVDQTLANSPVSGRLLVMMSTKLNAKNDLTPSFGPEAHSVWVAAKEVIALTPQVPIKLDPAELAYPETFCSAPAGTYHIKAVLDVNHDFAYDYEATDGDLMSTVVEQAFNPTANEVISLALTARESSPPLEDLPQTEKFNFVSPALSAFWGRAIHMTGMVVLPPSYATGSGRYPTIYFNHGFGGGMGPMQRRTAPNLIKLMGDKKIPEMIWVLLVQQSPTGTHEFADSVNNGPWGKALTTELIPFLEKKYRMDAKPSGRLLQGHSSGGWASMWLQVNYPGIFGGAWPTSPDPGDFRNFALVDLTKRPLQNFYYESDGTPRMLLRMGGHDVQSALDLGMQEQVLGEYSGQLGSFDWVFSPRGKDGRPMRMFDRNTGVIDPDVAAYWEEHYDIAHLLRVNWKKIGPKVDGKIHLTVGTADTIHLNESAQLLEETIKSLGGKADFTYLEGRDHFNLYQGGLLEKIANEMYAVARPAKK